MSGEDPYAEPRPLSEVNEQFIQEYGRPWLDRVDRPERRDMVALATKWDDEYNMPIEEYTWWWGTVGDFWDLFYAVNRYKVNIEEATS